MFQSGSLKIGRYFGVEVYLHYTWFFIFALVVWSLAVGFFPLSFPDLSILSAVLLAVLASILFFASVLIHELAHSVVSNRLNLPVKRITLFIFGGVAHLDKEPEKATDELKIALAGPITSFAIGAIALAVWLASPYLNLGEVTTAIAALIAQVNFILGAFNLLPGFPLDGGRILRALIWRSKRYTFKRATRITSYIGRAIGIGLIVFGIAEMFAGSFVNGLWFIFIGFFLERLAEQGYAQARIKDALAHVRVADLMSENVVAVPVEATITEVVRGYFLRHKFEGFPVIDKAGRVIGIVEMSQLRLVPEKDWPRETVQSIMVPVKKSFLLDPAGDIASALKVMSANRLKRLPVVSNGIVVGVLTQTDINHYLALQTEIMNQ